MEVSYREIMQDAMSALQRRRTVDPIIDLPQLEKVITLRQVLLRGYPTDIIEARKVFKSTYFTIGDEEMVGHFKSLYANPDFFRHLDRLYLDYFRGNTIGRQLTKDFNEDDGPPTQAILTELKRVRSDLHHHLDMTLMDLRNRNMRVLFLQVNYYIQLCQYLHNRFKSKFGVYEDYEGNKFFYTNGVLHRNSGPSIVYGDGLSAEYWWDGTKYSNGVHFSCLIASEVEPKIEWPRYFKYIPEEEEIREQEIKEKQRREKAKQDKIFDLAGLNPISAAFKRACGV
ncbi:MAG: hypothetical protein KF802_02880 [Bdellovibrionaceae bacterium]|nr:hypothetical protein [Pseudobdellovibrionaceae bacterium]